MNEVKNQMARINRQLKKTGSGYDRIRTSSPRQDSNLGKYYILDISKNMVAQIDVDLDACERDLRLEAIEAGTSEALDHLPPMNINKNEVSPFTALLDHLNSLESGPVQNPSEVEALLSICWHEFEGSDSAGTTGSKLRGRTEDMTWHSPLLSFSIERHGRTALGSIYADVHRWELDLQQKTATLDETTGKRRLYPKARAVKMGPITAEIADLIRTGKQDVRLRWKGQNQVTVNFKAVIPWGVNATFGGRKKRFKEGLSAALVSDGWEGGYRGIWQKTDQGASFVSETRTLQSQIEEAESQARYREVMANTLKLLSNR